MSRGVDGWSFVSMPTGQLGVNSALERLRWLHGIAESSTQGVCRSVVLARKR